jgi:hypothetical protein
MSVARLLTIPELEAGLDEIRRSPSDNGPVRLIVRRPCPGQREIVDGADLDQDVGLVGDDWKTRGCRLTADGTAHPDMQLTLMNARAVALLAQDKERWALAGDQFYLDLDLSVDNLPPGARLQLGTAVIEVTAEPHTGCKQFAARYGKDAVKFVNSPEGKRLRLRGLNAKIIQPGTVRLGELARKV